ncbi:MAG TPA: hypothetical protein P5230_03830 [Candidatus Magasanikbacteria bacterium]|nr:hypothetical protein [Candidatus Magasanikbacteria bacterium]
MKKQSAFVTIFILLCLFSISLPGATLPKDITDSVLAIDAKTGQILFEKNSDEVRPLASITKLISAMVLLDLRVDWNASTKIISIDCDRFSRQLIAGDVLKLNDLWNIALIGSVNSAMKALVRKSGVSEKQFVELMNKKAKDLNLNSMVFVEPSGLSSKNIGNAKDTAKLLKEALKFEKILKTLLVDKYYVQPLNKETPKQIYNTNWLMTNWIPSDFPKGSIVGKTGYLKNSGYNLSVRLTDDKNHQIIVIVLGAKSFTSRFSKARELANRIFNNYPRPNTGG